jgi:hypothetical protein
MAKPNVVSRKIEVEDGYLVNTKPGQRHPKGEPWEYSVFTTVVETRQRKSGALYEVRTRKLESFTGPERRDCDRQLLAFIEANGATVVKPKAEPKARGSRRHHCVECGRTGHNYRTCPQRKQAGQRVEGGK